MKKLFILTLMLGIALSSNRCNDPCDGIDCAIPEDYRMNLCLISVSGDTLTSNKIFVEDSLQLTLLKGEAWSLSEEHFEKFLSFQQPAGTEVIFLIEHLTRRDTLSFKQKKGTGLCCSGYYNILTETIRFNGDTTNVDFTRNIFYVNLK